MKVLMIGVLTLAFSSSVWATGSYHYHDYYRYYGYGFDTGFLDLDIARLRDDLRTQRQFFGHQSERAADELYRLRQELNRRQQVSAEQACYYRTTGGLEACEDMFEAASEQRHVCEEKVRLRNPGCAG